ncbi:class A sortase [Leuconostoc lactis]|uniref:class A sortase n=1 Tax=Leuconostoc lactis TaxID=1246 RepID=UPI00049779C3|nr:class A sortase [Leuconostoc lactis]
MIQGLLNILNWHPLYLAGLTFGLVMLLVFGLAYLRHRPKKQYLRWFYQALMMASLVTSITLGLDYLYQNNVGQLKDHTLNTLQKQRQKAQARQAKNDTTSRDQIAKMVMRQAQKGLEKRGFVAIPSRFILLPIYNDAYSNKGLDAGANYANRSAVDPLGTQKPIMGQGNYGLAGHNFNDGQSGFSALQESNNHDWPYIQNGQLKGSNWLNGEPVILANASGLFVYDITGQTTVNKNDIAVLNPTQAPTLTIISCLFPSTQYRIITHAALKTHYTWQKAPQDLVDLFNLRTQRTNAHVDWWNPGTEEGVNGDAGGTKK